MAASQQGDIAAAGASGVSWDPFQREVLAELGHVVYRQAGVAGVTDVETVCTDAPAAGVVLIDAAMIDGPMLAHVARAAGMSAEALQACIEDTNVIASLHGNASAKRALWPRLRALRRQRG